MTFFDCTADLVGQLNGNGQKGMLQIDAPPPRGKFLATPLVHTDQRDATRRNCFVESCRVGRCIVTSHHYIGFSNSSL